MCARAGSSRRPPRRYSPAETDRAAVINDRFGRTAGRQARDDRRRGLSSPGRGADLRRPLGKRPASAARGGSATEIKEEIRLQLAQILIDASTRTLRSAPGRMSQISRESGEDSNVRFGPLGKRADQSGRPKGAARSLIQAPVTCGLAACEKEFPSPSSPVIAAV